MFWEVETMMQQPVQIAEIANWLRARGAELDTRLRAVRADQARTRAPLSLDSADRATECENDDVVDAIGMRAESELLLINAALGRIEAGTFGRCVTCGSPIGEARLRAVPYALRCTECATTARSSST
jgi:RNA polymerase-binding transcription factor DksA